MVQCNKCRLFVSLAKDDVLKCKGPCEAIFHRKCVKNIKKFLKKEICEECLQKEECPQIEANAMEPSAEGLLREINKKLEVVYKIEKKLEDISESVDFYAEQYQQMIEFKEQTEKKIKSLEQKNIYLDKSNKALEEKLLEIEQGMKSNNVEIIGLDRQENENGAQLGQVVREIAQKLKLNPENITDTYRVGREKPDDKKPQPVIVKLKTKAARDQWIKSRKTTITNGDIYKNN